MKEKIRTFFEARKFVQSLGLKNQKEWYNFCKSGKKPNDIPSSPNKIFEKEWSSWGDWLGTGRVANQNRQFKSYAKSKEFVHSLRIQSIKYWLEYCKSGKIPFDIPKDPQKSFKNKGWISWGDWLGTGRIAAQNKVWRPFEEAKQFAISLNLQGESDWRKFTKSKEKPKDIPVDPAAAYKNNGWKSMGDWLGTGRVASATISNNYLSFKKARHEARKLAKKYNIKSWDDWLKAFNEGKLPSTIPQRPDKIYTDKKRREVSS